MKSAINFLFFGTLLTIVHFKGGGVPLSTAFLGYILIGVGVSKLPSPINGKKSDLYTAFPWCVAAYHIIVPCVPLQEGHLFFPILVLTAMILDLLLFYFLSVSLRQITGGTQKQETFVLVVSALGAFCACFSINFSSLKWIVVGATFVYKFYVLFTVLLPRKTWIAEEAPDEIR